jgi:hypothetical protein
MYKILRLMVIGAWIKILAPHLHESNPPLFEREDGGFF